MPEGPAAPRITVDPHQQQEPDWNAVYFLQVFEGLASEAVSVDDIRQRTRAAWAADRQQRIEAWDAQEAEDIRQEEERQRLQQEEDRLNEEEVRKRAEEARNASGRKESRQPRTFKPLAANQMVAKDSEPVASNYAVHKTEAFDYVELWYWTKEGCDEARVTNISTDPDALTLAKIDNQVVLKPSNASRPSRKVVPDGQLLWSQISVGKSGLLKQMAKSGWPQQYIASLGAFYLELESHAIRHEVMGEQAVIAYADEVRREWFSAIKPNSPKVAFNIGIINEDRLDKIHCRLLNQQQGRSIELLEAHAAALCLGKHGRSHSPSPPPEPSHHHHSSNRRVTDRTRNRAQDSDLEDSEYSEDSEGSEDLEPNAKRQRHDGEHTFHRDHWDCSPRRSQSPARF